MDRDEDFPEGLDYKDHFEDTIALESKIQPQLTRYVKDFREVYGDGWQSHADRLAQAAGCTWEIHGDDERLLSFTRLE